MSLAFSEPTAQRIAQVRSRYPTSQAALLPVLHLTQREFGHLSDESIDLVARTLELPAAHVLGVVTFYTMFHREKLGENLLMVCSNVSCLLRGSDRVLKRIEEKLGIKPGQTTPDRKFTLIEEECLAACADAPMAVCGQKYFLNLDDKKIDEMLEQLAAHPEKY